MKDITIILADDHPLLRLGLREIIHQHAGYRVISEAGNGERALQLIEQLRPTIAILDIDMPKLSGLEVVKQMLKLATSGFGLVAALAWNQLISTAINNYVKSKLSVSSGILSLAIYALVVTFLAVFVTLQLSKLAGKLEGEQKDKNKKESEE